MKTNILILCENQDMHKEYAEALKVYPYEITFVKEKKLLKKTFSEGKYFSLIVLDVERDTPAVLQTVITINKQWENLPLVVVSDDLRDETVNRVLEAGAGDYIEKPINPVIFGAMIKAVLRRSILAGNESDHLIQAGPFCYNESNLKLSKNGEIVGLTGKENSIMKLFLDNPNRVFSIQELYRMIWGNNIADDNTIMVYISRLRQKIEDDHNAPRYIQNVRGKGYRFVAE